MRRSGQYTAQTQSVSNIVHKNTRQRGSVLQHVSQNIKRLRLAAEFSQSALAEKSGVSRRMLVAIEAGEKNVSLTTLDRLAEALGAAFSDLIRAPDSRDPSRINELAWAGVHPGSRAVLLASSVATREVELWEWRLEPGEVYQCEADADGWSEQLYIAEGCLTLVIGERNHHLQAGDFFSYASNCIHAYRNEGDVATRFVRNVVI